MSTNDKIELARQSARLDRGAHRFEPIIDHGTLPSEWSSTLQAYWDIARRRWGLTAVTALVVVTLTAIYTFKSKPVYRATAQVGIESETPQLQTLNSLYQNLPTDEAFLRTQVKVLQSDNLAFETVQQLELASNPAFLPRPSGSKTLDQTSRQGQGILLSRFQGALSVSLSPNTHVVEVSFESTDPDLAAQIANALVKNYIEYNFHEKYDATRQATGWMEQQLDELKANVEKSQRALVTYERANAIVNVNDKQNVVEQRLSDLSKDLTAAESDLAQKESLYNLVRSNPSRVALIAQNELLQRLEEKYADLETRYTEARAASSPNYPKVVNLEKQVEEMQSLIDQERRRTVERTERDYKAAVGRVKLLQAAVAQQKAEVGELNQLLIQHNILKHDFESNQQLYENLLQHLKDATVSAGLRATNINVVDPARPPAFPIRPRKAVNIAIGLIVGLLLGITLAVAQEGLQRRTIKTVEDVERLADLPALGLIPLAASAHKRSYALTKAKPTNGSRNGSVACIVSTEPASPVAESYRALQTSILFSSNPPPRTILVTSPGPGEGKTSTAVNLATVLAEGGRRVVLVDADMRRPGVSQTFALLKSKGLSGVLTGAYPLDEAIMTVESIPSLRVLPAGPHTPNPASLLSTSDKEALLQRLSETFDYVVVDSPPVLLVTDATILSSIVDGVILIVESGATGPASLVRAFRTLDTAGARLLGVAVNKFDFQTSGYYYSHYNDYGYYYSYHGSSKDRERSASDADAS